MTEQIANFGHTNLDEALDDSETGVDVTAGSVFPASGDFRVIVDSEIMKVTSRATNTLTVERGAEGTVAAAHSNGADIDARLTRDGIKQMIYENAPESGTTFPGTPGDGQPFFRTDIHGGRLFHYDSTNTEWVSDIIQSNVFAFGVTITNFYGGFGLDEAGLDVRVVDFTYALSILSGSHTGANFWTIKIFQLNADGSGGAGETLASVDSDDIAPGLNNLTGAVLSIDAKVDVSTDPAVGFFLTKVASAGPIRIYGDIRWRYIAT